MSHASTTPAVRYRSIDGLRAIAITLVLVRHFMPGPFYTWLEARGFGYLATLFGHSTNAGVELFFVLSGVVLLRPYLRDKRLFAARTYFSRRVQRLWPPYLVAWLLGGAVILLVTLEPSWYSIDVLPRFSLQRWLLQSMMVSFGWWPYNVAWWSLTPEILFYLVVPLLVLLIVRAGMGRDALLALLLVLAAASVATWDPLRSNPGIQPGVLAALHQLLAYSPCFAAGVLLARSDLPVALARAMLALGIGWVLWATHYPPANVHLGFGLLFGGLVSFALRDGTRFARFVGRPAFVWVGERSYSLFILHHSALYLANHIAALFLPERNLAYVIFTRSTGLVLSFAGAALLFWFVERRFARGLATANAFWPWTAPVPASMSAASGVQAAP